ncbi:unnamed protein product [Rhizoctonia solani]|uniref:Uncharacterized protein n=1 Tax=Rhizoctonia solani TaxID=456999 RepID=A0A8H3E5N2_9AGAM|nr:unnamed protein product [Rhizoctonia solani]
MEDHYDWVEAFEAWLQRRNVHINWQFTPVSATNQWSATVVVAGHVFTGVGPSKSRAKKDTVMQIANAQILY